MKKNIFVIFLILVVNLSFCEVFAQRLVSLSPAATETLFALGLDKEIVGVTTFCNYPQQALKKEKIGSYSYPDIEKIVLLNPDVVFADQTAQSTVISKLRQLKFKVYSINPANFKELFNVIRDIAKLTHREKQAEFLVGCMKKKISYIQQKVKTLNLKKKPKVFVKLWEKPLLTAGKKTFINQLVKLSGAVNIAQDSLSGYGAFSFEKLVFSKPDCVIVLAQDADIILRPGPRIVLGLEQIYQQVYEPKL